VRAHGRRCGGDAHDELDDALLDAVLVRVSPPPFFLLSLNPFLFLPLACTLPHRAHSDDAHGHATDERKRCRYALQSLLGMLCVTVSARHPDPKLILD